MKLKKMLSILLAAAMLIGTLSGCGNSNSGETTASTGNGETTAETNSGDSGSESEDSASADASALPAMTTDEITLTYMNFDNDPLTQYLADKFEEIYPNIKVEVIYHAADGEYNDSLLNLVSAGQTPDCFMILGNCDFALTNSLLGDMTEYWENDPENADILPSIDGAKLGYYGTDQKWATPIKFFPAAIYADMAVFEKLNVELPPTDWTWDEMVQSFKDVTSPDDGIYGFNQYYTLVTFYPIAANADAIGEFGWDGTQFNMTDWAVGLDTLAELMNGKYRAPVDDEERIAWLGADIWPGFSGKIGYQVDAWWTYLNLFDTDEYRDKGIEFVPYATPTAEDNETGYKFGVLDFGGISSGTAYPREAYELLKFMGWGVEGWTYKLEAYKTLTAEDGTPIYQQSMPLPITLDDDIWTDLTQYFYPTLTKDESEQDEKDQKYGQYFDDYFEQVKRGVIPFGDCQIPGFAAFVNGETGPYAGVEASVINGEKTASDWVEEMENQANEYNKQAMEAAFGE